jgi:hypothetical protein
MKQAIKATINLSKLDKTAFWENKTGEKMLSILLWPDEERKYDNDFSVKQDMGKDRKGERTPFIGNARFLGGGQRSNPQPQRPARNAAPQVQVSDDGGEDSIPF